MAKARDFAKDEIPFEIKSHTYLTAWATEVFGVRKIFSINQLVGVDENNRVGVSGSRMG
jgi:hypothetical protein